MTTAPSRPPLTRSLVTRSVEVIRAGQHDAGAYVACPTYETYRYAWLRDGAFCAYAMDLSGQRDSAAAFHRWVARTLLAHRDRVERAIRAAATPEHLPLMLPTRFTLLGQEEEPGAEAWPNFQLDGYGTWLWALRDHAGRGGVVDADTYAAADLASRYLQAAAALPCYDCWEEFGQRRHTSTKAAVAAGLRAAAQLLDDPKAAAHATALADDLRGRHVADGAFVKHDGDRGVDASLLWLALPFGLVDVDDPMMTATARRIRAELCGPGGGVRRYRGDTFYGGGEWILLTAWLGWYDASTGDTASATALRTWVEATATADGRLPEQVTDHPQAPDMVQPWVDKWGPVATPLLWSHAMYLVLVHALDPAR